MLSYYLLWFWKLFLPFTDSISYFRVNKIQNKFKFCVSALVERYQGLEINCLGYWRKLITT